MSDLDAVIPVGTPTAVQCRWCRSKRIPTPLGFLACLVCDMVANWPRAQRRPT